ncbi:MAG: nuclear transport factor 2 family protein [Chloroflexota bacterium]
MATHLEQMKVVEQFAAALDNEDYEAAYTLLSPTCTYEISERVLRGSDSIIASYRANGEWVAANIDSVTYRSSIEEDIDGDRFLVRFEDQLTHKGKQLTHACQQIMQLDASGKINRIEHRDLPGEPEALKAFFQEVGIKRESQNV